MSQEPDAGNISMQNSKPRFFKHFTQSKKFMNNKMNATSMNWGRKYKAPQSFSSSLAGDSRFGDHDSGKPLSSNDSKRLFDLKSKISRVQKRKPPPPTAKKPQKNSMNYDEIKRIREEFKLERHEVYTLMSEFNSMMYMQENSSDFDSSDDEKAYKSPSKTHKQDTNKSQSYLDNPKLGQDDGIKLEFFFENSTFMKGILPEVGRIIVNALGLDAASTNTKINWENYVILYCMLEKSGILPYSKLILVK